MALVKISPPDSKDLAWIVKNAELCALKTFPTANPKEVFEMATWSLVLKDNENILACMAFTDYPNIYYNPIDWEKQLKRSIVHCPVHGPLSGLNTLFLRTFICESMGEEHLEVLLKHTFNSIPTLVYCCFLTREQEEVNETLLSRFQLLDTTREGFRLWSCDRNHNIRKIGIRSKKSEDYLALKNIFSQMFTMEPNDTIQNFTLDFLDYGEDTNPTYKYFTFDEGNTYIAVADTEDGEAVGFVYATTNRLDLDALNLNFQLEMVYGLRKVHPKDDPEILFSSGEMKAEILSLEEEEAVLGGINDVIDVVDVLLDINLFLEDLLDGVVEMVETGDPEGCGKCLDDILQKIVRGVCINAEIEFENKSETKEKDMDDEVTKDKPRQMSSIENELEISLIENESELDQSAPTIDKNITPEGLVRYINSPSFNPINRKHMELVPLLKQKITEIKKDRLDEILNSNVFDPSIEGFAEVSLYVMEKMPPIKMSKFVKSSIGSELYDKVRVKKATRKEKSNSKLSYMDKQAILREASEAVRHKKLDHVKSHLHEKSSAELLTHINHRNMGFISGLVTRDKFKINNGEDVISQPNPSVKKYDSFMESSEKHPIPKFDSEARSKVHIPIYHGANNCLFIEHLAIEKDHEAQCLLLIMAALNYFPKVDFCVLLLPYGTRQVPMLRKYFTPIPARPFTFYKKELYVLHRYSFNESLKVRRYAMKDFQGVWNLIRCSCLSQHLVNDLTTRVMGSDPLTSAVVMVSEDNILGIAVITLSKDVGDIRRYYDVGDKVNMKFHKHGYQGQLLHCILHPSARGMSSMFLKEAMRLTQKSILFYKMYNSHYVEKNPSYWQSICNVIDQLLPLRLIKKQPSKRAIRMIDDKSEVSSVRKPVNFNLCYVTTKSILSPKYLNSARIVLMGRTDVVFGIIESLIYDPYYRFTNVVAFSSTSMVFKMNEVCQKFETSKSEYERDLIESMCLPAWVTGVLGSVVQIDHNVIHFEPVDGKSEKRFQMGYDYLVICEELKFQIKSKRPTEEPGKTKRKYSLLKNLDEYVYEVEDAPQNLFTVNSCEDGARAINWIWRYLKRKEERQARKLRRQNKDNTEEDVSVEDEETVQENIVIFGNCINAYVCLAVLMEEAFPNVRFTFVKGPKRDRSDSFNTPDVEAAVDHIIRRSNVQVRNGLLMYETKRNEIYLVDIKDENGEVDCIDCAALFVFSDRNIHDKTFKALHESNLALSLPLEGGMGYLYLHVNANFQTNAGNVFAAGSLVEMHVPRKKKGFRMEVGSYNRREVGLMIGENIRKRISNELPPADSYPKLKLPSVEVAYLPNSYIYAHIKAPSFQFREDVEDEVDTEDRLLPRNLALGNLKTGDNLVPSSGPKFAVVPEEVDKNESEGKNESQEGNNKESESEEELALVEADDPRQKTSESAEASNPDASIPQEEEAPVEKQYPDVPDFISFTFSTTERVEGIECLTTKEVDIDSLVSLYDLPLTQFYKILPVMKGEGGSEASFRVTGNWVLPLDHFTLWDNESISEKNRDGIDLPPTCGFNGFWRPEYPEDLQDRIDGFLNSFVKDRGQK